MDAGESKDLAPDRGSVEPTCSLSILVRLLPLESAVEVVGIVGVAGSVSFVVVSGSSRSDGSRRKRQDTMRIIS